MKSFILFTKEYYSDGESMEYEDIIWASDKRIAEDKAKIKISIRNNDLGKHGKCHYVHLSKND